MMRLTINDATDCLRFRNLRRHYLLKVLQYPLSFLSNFLLELYIPESCIRNKACDTIDLLISLPCDIV